MTRFVQFEYLTATLVYDKVKNRQRLATADQVIDETIFLRRVNGNRSPSTSQTAAVRRCSSAGQLVLSVPPRVVVLVSAITVVSLKQRAKFILSIHVDDPLAL